MGLVSKEKLLEKLGQFHPDYMFNIASIRNFIKAQPEVEKKGKLLNANPVGECSVCGWLIDYRDEFNYCPHCGVRLEESEESDG